MFKGFSVYANTSTTHFVVPFGHTNGCITHGYGLENTQHHISLCDVCNHFVST